MRDTDLLEQRAVKRGWRSGVDLVYVKAAGWGARRGCLGASVWGRFAVSVSPPGE